MFQPTPALAAAPPFSASMDHFVTLGDFSSVFADPSHTVVLTLVVLLLIALWWQTHRSRTSNRLRSERLEKELASRRVTEDALRKSEERYRNLLNTSGVVAWEVDLPSLRFTYVSPQAVALFGYPVEEWYREGFWPSHIHPDDRDNTVSACARHTDALLDHTLEYRMIHANGNAVWVHDRIDVLVRDGKAIGLHGVMIDITKQKDIEGVLQQTERLANIGGWKMDIATMAPIWSDQVYRIHEVPITDRPDLRRAIEFYAPEARPLIAKAVEESMRTGKSYDLEVPFITATGKRLWVRSIGEPLMKDGRCIRLSGTFQDITDRKNAEEALRRSEEHYRRAAESNRRLLNEVNHRVRNNLGNLLGMISMLRRRAATSAQLAESLERCIQAMAQTQDLLARAQWSGLDLRNLLHNAIESVRSSTQHNVNVQLDGPPTRISARQSLPLTLMTLELLTNSIKYGAHHSPTGMLSITWQIVEREGKPCVRLRWVESGGPPITGPIARSIGTELIDGFVSFELGGTCTLGFPEPGVDHTLEFPLDTASEAHPQPPDAPPAS